MCELGEIGGKEFVSFPNGDGKFEHIPSGRDGKGLQAARREPFIDCSAGLGRGGNECFYLKDRL